MHSLVTVMLLMLLIGTLNGCSSPGEAKPVTPPTPTVAELDALRIEAESAYGAREWPRAAAAYRNLVAAVPGDAAYWFRLGTAEARSGNPDPAVRALQEAVVREPKMSKAWYNMSIVHVRRAENALSQLLEYGAANDPNVGRASALLGRLADALQFPSGPSSQESDEIEDARTPAPVVREPETKDVAPIERKAQTAPASPPPEAPSVPDTTAGIPPEHATEPPEPEAETAPAEDATYDVLPEWTEASPAPETETVPADAPPVPNVTYDVLPDWTEASPASEAETAPADAPPVPDASNDVLPGGTDALPEPEAETAAPETPPVPDVTYDVLPDWTEESPEPATDAPTDTKVLPETVNP